jgi:hypothetical protein
MAFGKVPAGQLLQIDNINCAGLAGAFLERAILFNTNLMLDEHLVAAFTSSSASTGHIVIASGPFYFKEGEVPRLTAAGHFSGDQAYCSVAGTLWQVN